MRKSSLLVPAVLFVAAACSAGTATPSAPPTTPAPPTPRYAVESGADKLVLRISTSGGFIGPSADLTRLPEFALYGDGSVVVPGPQIEIYPAPLLPNVQEMHVSPAEIQRILAAADAAGLLGPDAAYPGVGMPDAGLTMFVVRVGGVTHTISASPAGADAAGSDPRVILGRFRESVENLPAFLGRSLDQASFEPAGYRLFLAPAEGSDPAAASGVVAWPLAADPATGSPTIVEGLRCLAVTGADAAAFRAAAATANAATLWRAASGDWAAQVRPLYPDEKGC